jgi:dihydrodiol dehydrogenase / D-xylose 1-dehydrogenase (NADP)
MDDESIVDPLQCPPLRWGLIGCGRVSHDFTQALKHLPSASVVACSARDENRAKEFADKHGISKAYGDYERLIADKDVDIIYVGNLHAFRRSVGERCLKANKHVLLEKPFACTALDASYLIGLAKERNLFLMEGMWTRFFPAFEQARRIAFGSNEGESILGEVVSVFSDFNFNASDSEIYPSSFVYNRKLGGGASLLTGPYPIAAVTAFFPASTPDNIKVVGQVDELTEVDLQAAVALSFPPNGTHSPALEGSIDSSTAECTPKLPGSGVATLSYGMLGESVEETTVVGTKGRLTIKTPGHCPTKLIVSLKSTGRAAASQTIEFDFPLPKDTDDIKTAGGFVYPNSAGFCYEAAAVARCIASGKTEAPQYTLAETMLEMEILDEVRKQLETKAVDEE